MRVLLDAVHAADVWTLGAVEDRLLAEGAETLWLSRPGKDAVVELIESRGRPHMPTSTAGVTMPGLARELVTRDRLTLKAVRQFQPDLILTRSPAGAQIGWLTRTPVIYDTDDGRAAGALYWAAAPFAKLITSPMATFQSDSRRHRRYQGYKELFYLHPDRFTPDPTVREEVGISPSVRVFVLRLTSFTASHDTSESGLNRDQIERLISRLSEAGRVVVSSEGALPSYLSSYAVPIRPERFHHLLATADLVVGDGQSVCSEAAVMGTPSIRFTTWAGRHAYQVELERRWGLTRAFSVDQQPEFFAEVERVLQDLPGTAARHAEGRDRMLEWCSDPVDNLVEWSYELSDNHW